MKKIIIGSLMLVSIMVEAQTPSNRKPPVSQEAAPGQYKAAPLERAPLTNSPAPGVYKSEPLKRGVIINTSQEPVRPIIKQSNEKIVPLNKLKASGGNFEPPTLINQENTVPIKSKYSSGLDVNEMPATQNSKDMPARKDPIKTKTSGGL